MTYLTGPVNDFCSASLQLKWCCSSVSLWGWWIDALAHWNQSHESSWWLQSAGPLMNTHEAGGSASGQHLPLKTVQVPFTPRIGSAAGMVCEGILLILHTLKSAAVNVLWLCKCRISLFKPYNHFQVNLTVKWLLLQTRISIIKHWRAQREIWKRSMKHCGLCEYTF